MVGLAQLLNSESPALAAIPVGDFFKQINWSGQPVPVLGQDPAEEAPYETVGQFFSTFPWQGTEDTITADDWELIADEPAEVLVDDGALTLEDLSALF